MTELTETPKSSTSSAQRPAVFIDRDGTINQQVGYIADPAGVKLIPHAAQAIARINRMGFLTIMVTNQSAVARGLATISQVERVCSEVALQVAREAEAHFDGVYYCPYHGDHPHPEFEQFREWRKPRPGMILQAARDFSIDLERSWLIGDGWIDHLAAKAANPGVRTIMLHSVYSKGTEGADFYVDTLWDAVHIIASKHNLDEAMARSKAPRTII